MAVQVDRHRVTTADLAAAYPWMPEGPLNTFSVLIGRDLNGGAFCFDSWQLYPHTLTSPNMFVLGMLGCGKSALVKTFGARQLAFGRKLCVLDSKLNSSEGRGEYGRLCDLVGVPPIRLEPGGRVKINPLDVRMASHEDRPFLDQLEVLQAVAGAALRRNLTESEKQAYRLALLDVMRRWPDEQPILPRIAEAMLRPSGQSAEKAACSSSELRDRNYEAAVALGNLAEGVMAGMFDSPTTEGIEIDSPLIDLDLTGIRHLGDEALSIVMVCAQAWLNRAMRADRANWILINEEAWHCLRNLAIARWQQETYKLARERGIMNVAVIHRLSDLAATGSADSEQMRLALGLIRDSETHVIYRQPPGEVAALREQLHLSDTECDLVSRLPNHQALWRVGQRRFWVEHRISEIERWVIDTDDRMLQD